MDLNVQRRSLIGAGLLSAGAWLGQRFGQSALAQGTAASAALSSHSSGMTTRGEVNHKNNGFDPHTLLTQWNTGKVSTLPNGQRLREYEIAAIEREIEVAPGVFYPAWTYNAQVPGPTIRVTEGDRIRIRFTNQGKHLHTLHFHGMHAARQDGIPGVLEAAPGQSVSYEFEANPFGCHLYHCHSMPFKRHPTKGSTAHLS